MLVQNMLEKEQYLEAIALLQGKSSYRTGVALWLAGDRAAAIAAFQAGRRCVDRRYRYLCRGFTYFLSSPDVPGRMAALREFANAELVGGSDFSMLFASGLTAWQLGESLLIDQTCQANSAVLLLLAQRALYAVQVEMPKPMLQSLELQYDLVVSHLTAQLEHKLEQIRQGSPQTDSLLTRLAYPSCNLSLLVEELGLSPVPEQLCLVDRLLVAGAFLSQRLLAGQPADLTELLAAT
ncbi:MAG: hypothetical protein ACOX2K_05060 [Bacillota bacterium]